MEDLKVFKCPSCDYVESGTHAALCPYCPANLMVDQTPKDQLSLWGAIQHVS